MIYLVPFMQEREMVDLHISSISAFADKNISIWMCNFSYYKLYVNNDNVYIYMKRVHAKIGLGVGGIYSGFIFLPVLDFYQIF